jgi:WXG100 family type VII secretion target
MPSDFLSGQTPEMDRAAAVADGIVGNLHSHQAALQPVVDAARSHWRGTALPAFEAKHEEWRQALVRFTTELTRLADAARKSSMGYLGANDESAAAVNSVQAGAAYGGALGGPVSAGQ